jgi:hypothetical protein
MKFLLLLSVVALAAAIPDNIQTNTDLADWSGDMCSADSCSVQYDPADDATLQAREDAVTEQSIPPTYTCSARQCAKVTVACDGKEKCIDTLCSKQSRVSGHLHVVRVMTDDVQCNLCPVCKGRHEESSASTLNARDDAAAEQVVDTSGEEPVTGSSSNFKKWLCDQLIAIKNCPVAKSHDCIPWCSDVEKRAPGLEARQWFMTPKGAPAKCWDIANNCPKGNLKDCITY